MWQRTQVHIGLLSLSAALGRVEMSEAVPGGKKSSKFACPLQTASATSFSCLPPAPVSLGKVILKQLLAFMFCLEGGCAYILLLCNIKPTCQRDLALDWDPETQQSTEKKLSGIFLFIHWKCGSDCSRMFNACQYHKWWRDPLISRLVFHLASVNS